LTEADEVINWLAAGQEGDGMVVITIGFMLVFVYPVEDCTDSWVLVSWGNCPLHFIEAGDIFFFCHGGKLCCRESRHNNWIRREWC
jgi:hypothetical protein